MRLGQSFLRESFLLCTFVKDILRSILLGSIVVLAPVAAKAADIRRPCPCAAARLRAPMPASATSMAMRSSSFPALTAV